MTTTKPVSGIKVAGSVLGSMVVIFGLVVAFSMAFSEPPRAPPPPRPPLTEAQIKQGIVRLPITFFACLTSYERRRYSQLIISGDDVAADKYQDGMLTAKRCTWLQSGDDAYVVEANDSEACYREVGTVPCVWGPSPRLLKIQAEARAKGKS